MSAIKGLYFAFLKGTITMNLWSCVLKFAPIGELIGPVCNILRGVPRGTLSPARSESIVQLFKSYTILFFRYGAAVESTRAPQKNKI